MITMRKAIVFLWIAALAGGAAHADGEEAQKIDPRDLPAEEFLRYARRPFVQDAWGYFSGTVQHRGQDGTRKLPIELSILFKRDLIKAQLVLDETQVYDITQVYMGQRVPQITVSEPEKKPGRTALEDLGLNPRDITFAFLYWVFMEEADETDKVRGQECRVMLLDNPQDATQQARVWFSAKYLFPLRVQTLDTDSDEVRRELEFTDFKRHDDIWYIKALRLEGKDWKTRVNFRQAELSYTEDKSPPANLFAPPKF